MSEAEGGGAGVVSDPKTPVVIGEEEEPVTAIEAERNQAATELAQEDKKSGKPSMQIKVYSPYKEYFNSSAFSVSAVNLTGPFDVLPGHHNFISLLSPCEMVVRTSKGDQKIQISGGVIHVKADRVIVFLDV